MLQVFALEYGERQTTACRFFFREASHDDTTHALAGDRSRIVAGHDPEVAERFKLLEPGVVQIA
jgi:hypothetical protein